ncbi:MAG: trypsin-like peptidase domain-containing protein [Methylococcaceae bacterium]
MSKLEDSIVFITSAESNGAFGTGFVFLKQDNYSYILTCAHVLEDINANEIGISKKIKLEGITEHIEVIACGSIETIDLAVLKIKNLQNPALTLMNLGREGLEISIAGLSDFDGFKRKRITLDGTLATSLDLTLEGGSYNQAWYLKMDTIEKEHGLDAGYSGSPVVLKDRNIVIAVTSNQRRRKDEGQYDECERGYAVSISNLLKIWKDIPDELKKRLNEDIKIYPDLSDKNCQLLIEALKSDKNNYYSIQAWLAYSHKDFEKIYVKEKYEAIDLYDINSTTKVIDDLLEEVRNRNISYDKLTFEFILPLELFNYPIDQWQNEDKKPIGAMYPIIIRSQERLIHRKLRDFWKTLQPELENLSSEKIDWLAEPQEEEVLDFKLSEEGYVGFALEFDLSKTDKKFLFNMLKNGAVIGIWANSCQDFSCIKQNINKDLFENKQLKDIPRTFLSIRRKLRLSKKCDYYLTLFWDDKERIPPDFKLEQPKN